MASRERTGRGRGRGHWQKQKQWTNSRKRWHYKLQPQADDLAPPDHPDSAIWRRFPEVKIVTNEAFDKQLLLELCAPYGDIVGSRTDIQNDRQSQRNYQEMQSRRREWGNKRRYDALQKRSEIIATYKFTFTTDEAARNCYDALHGQTLKGFRIQTWFNHGEKRCCPRPLSGRTSPEVNTQKGKSDLLYPKGSSELDSMSLDHQNNVDNENLGNSSPDIDSMQEDYYESIKKTKNMMEEYEIEKCISSNEAMNILDGIEIVTPGHFNMLNHSEKLNSLESKENCKQVREFKDVIIDIEGCESFSNETEFPENQEGIENKIPDLNDVPYENTPEDQGLPIEMPNLEFNSLLEFLQMTPEKNGESNKVVDVDNETSDPLNSMKMISNVKKKKKKKQPKEKKTHSEKDKKENCSSGMSSSTHRGSLKTERSVLSYKGNWKCQDPSCTYSNSGYDELCIKCKLPCPESMRGSIEKLDESKNFNKYYLAYAKSAVEIYVQDYTQKRDATKMTEILNKRFEKGHKPLNKNQKDGVFAVQTKRGWVRGRVIDMCYGINCSLLDNGTTQIDDNVKQEELKGIENNRLTDCTFLSSSDISYESNYKYNVDGEYYEKNVKIPYMEITSSVLEHQIMIEEENINMKMIKDYLDSIDNVYNHYENYAKTAQYNEMVSVLDHKKMVEENDRNDILIHEYLKSIDNIHLESEEKNEKILRRFFFPLSALEHQLMVERECEYETIIEKYLNYSLPENANTNIVPSLKYLVQRKLEESWPSYSLEMEKDISKVRSFDLLQEQRNDVNTCSINRKIINDSINFVNSIRDESYDYSMKVDIDVKNCKEGIKEEGKFCHVILIDYGECICIEYNNLALLLREIIGISEMKTGPIYLENCIPIDLTDEKKEEGRKWIETILADKSFQVKWNIESEYSAEIFLSDRLINKEVCDMGYAKQGLPYRKCNTCGKVGHTNRECPDRIKKTTCFKCGESGHSKKTCPGFSNKFKQPYVKDETEVDLHEEYLKNSQPIENSFNIFNSTGNIAKTIFQHHPTYKCLTCRSSDRNCICHNDVKDIERNNDCKTVDTQDSNRRDITDIMVPYDNRREMVYDNRREMVYDNRREMLSFDNRREVVPFDNRREMLPFDNGREMVPFDNRKEMGYLDNRSEMVSFDAYSMSQAQDRYRDITDCFPLHKYDYSPYPMMRLNSSLQSSVYAPLQNPYWVTPNDLYQVSQMSTTMLADANYHLSNTEGQVRALQEELTRIRSKGFPGLLDVMDKMKSLVKINTGLAKIIGADEPMERAISFLNENTRHLMTPGQIKLDDFLSDAKSLQEKNTAHEQLAAMKVHLEAVKGMCVGKSTVERTRYLEKNLTYEDAIDHYNKWKNGYEKTYAKVKTYYNNTIMEWVTFSNDAKNILDGAPEPKKPDGADIKKFFDQAAKLERLHKESEQIVGNLPKLLFNRIKNSILQLERFVLQLEAMKSKELKYNFSNNEAESSGKTLSQYVATAKKSLPITQVDQILQDILEAVGIEHSNHNSFGCIHPNNIVVTNEGVIKLCPIVDRSSHMKIYEGEYTAPEVRQGKPSKASDIYSIGKIIKWLTYSDNKSYIVSEQKRKKIAAAIREMTLYNPAQRPSIQEILSMKLFVLSKIDEEYVDDIQDS